MRGRAKVTCRELALSAAAALLILACGPGGGPGPGPEPGPPTPGRECGTEIPDPTEMVVGCLVDEFRKPVPGVKVLAGTLGPNSYPGKHDFETVVSATTDHKGLFRFGDLDSGVYYYFNAQEGSLSMPTFKLKVLNDTVLESKKLLRTGQIEGILRSKQDGTPLPSVLCVVENQLYSTASDDDGRFTLHLPLDTVTLVCGVGRNDMIETRTEVVVVAEKTTTLEIPLTLLTDEDKVRPPGPTGLSYRYDPALGIVYLSWPRVTTGPGGMVYVLRRTDLSIGSAAVQSFTTPDTSLADVIPWPKDEDGMVRTRHKLILYNLSTAFLGSGTLSKTMIDTQITISPPRFLGPEVEVRLLGDTTTFRVGDTARIVGTWLNPYRDNSQLAWIWDTDGTELKPRLDSLGTAGADTLVYPCTTSGKFGIRFKVTDISGAAASALQIIEIESDP